MAENRRENHTLTRLSVHIVWATKYRYHVLKGEIQKRCRELLIQICDAEDIRILKGGSPRLHAGLLARGFAVGPNRVDRLMRQLGICAHPKRRFRVTTDSNHDWPVAANLLERQLHAPEPDWAWWTDITYTLTTGGWLYLTVVLDLFSQRVVG